MLSTMTCLLISTRMSTVLEEQVVLGTKGLQPVLLTREMHLSPRISYGFWKRHSKKFHLGLPALLVSKLEKAQARGRVEALAAQISAGIMEITVTINMAAVVEVVVVEAEVEVVLVAVGGEEKVAGEEKGNLNNNSKALTHGKNEFSTTITDLALFPRIYLVFT
mmetsp:Transcript_15685/g.25644  ORF Transcript_15685/g.25644 Transcript_15685/m.25644 type:complete len:164 (+) Transcript_15685:1547-2038(+)